MTYQQLKRLMDDLKKYNPDYTYDSNPIQERTRMEYYKNGKVKARISDLLIREPYEHIVVRNKDYHLYSFNRQHTIDYLTLLNMTYMYEENIKRVWKDLSEVQNKANDIFCDTHILKNNELDKIEVLDNNVRHTDILRIVKPTLLDEKYIYKKRLFDKLLGRKTKKTLLLKDEFKNDLVEYQKNLKVYDLQILSEAEISYQHNLKIYAIQRKKTAILEKFSDLDNSYLNFNDSSRVKEYFLLLISEALNNDCLYSSTKLKFDIDMDSKNIYIDLKIPSTSILPIYKEFRVTKKDLNCIAYEYSKKEKNEIFESVVNSYILFHLYLLKKIDTANKTQNIILNLYFEDSYMNNTDSFTTCNKILRVNLHEVNTLEIKAAKNIMKKLTGNDIIYSDLEQTVLPIRKEGM